MKLDLKAKIVECLKASPQNKFTARELATWVFENYPEICEAKRARSSQDLSDDTAFISQLTAEVSSWNATLEKLNYVKLTEDRPKKYYYSEQSDQEEVLEAEAKPISSPKDASRPSEHSLYPLLSLYLRSELGIYSKRIDEKRSSNRHGPSGNRWLYPDIVGMEELSAGWGREIKDCVQQYSDKKTKLWSFEVKILINRSNVREVFFQAVSNSSWANFGYLVASEVQGSEAMKELRMLSSLHGIGFILLNAEAPAESQIMIPATERVDIDWNSANRLAEENTDYTDFIKLVRQFYQTGDLRESDWD